LARSFTLGGIAHMTHVIQVQENQIQERIKSLQLRPDDFPLRIFFLDKSACMGFCDAQFQCLALAAVNAMSPAQGSSLTFLLSAPGETQIVFRQPRDPPCRMLVALGTATWFNEPVVKVLEALAFAMEEVQTGLVVRGGEPPVQVVCFTDGMDNMSHGEVRSLQGLVDAVNRIVGPKKNEVLYQPLTKLGQRKEFTASGAQKIPVWLFWVLIGPGAQPLLNSVPNEITLVNAVVPHNGGVAHVAPRHAGSGIGFNLGQVAWLRPPDWVLASEVPTLTDPNARRQVVIIGCPDANNNTYTVLHQDDVEEMNVEGKRLMLLFQSSLETAQTCTETAAKVSQGDFLRLQAQADTLNCQALRLVNAASTNPGSLLKVSRNIWESKDPGAASSSASRDELDSLGRAGHAALTRAKIREVPSETLAEVNSIIGKDEQFLAEPPEGFLQNLMQAIGGASCGLVEREHAVAQAITHAILTALGQGQLIQSNDLFQHYVEISGQSMTGQSESLLRPALAALSHLASVHVLQQWSFTYSVEDSQILTLRAACRFLEPGWDAIARSCDRYIHQQRRQTVVLHSGSGAAQYALARRGQPRQRHSLLEMPAATAQPRFRTSRSASMSTLARTQGPLVGCPGRALRR